MGAVLQHLPRDVARNRQDRLIAGKSLRQFRNGSRPQIVEPLMAEADRRGIPRDSITVVIDVVEAAFQARKARDNADHDRMVSAAIMKMAGNNELDAIVLAQASMTGTVHDDPGVPVLKLGPSAFRAAGEMLAVM